MIKASASVASKVWTKFSVKTSNGTNMKLRIEQLLTNDRLKEFVDFNMKYFVQHEISHVASGIPNSEDAMEEYRQIVTQQLEKPSNQLLIVTPDDGREEFRNSEIVAISFTKLITYDDLHEEIVKAQTKEVRKYFKMFRDWEKIFPIPDILNKYGVDSIIEDGGCAVHSDYRKLGIFKPFFPLRRLMCQDYGVRMTGAWLTSPASQFLAEQDGWETFNEISCEQLGRMLGVTFKTTTPTFKYMIGRAP